MNRKEFFGGQNCVIIESEQYSARSDNSALITNTQQYWGKSNLKSVWDFLSLLFIFFCSSSALILKQRHDQHLQ